jgi:DNA-binding CsgD family transcriptional regulator
MVTDGTSSPKVFGHAVCVALTDNPLHQFRDDTIYENDFLSYTGSSTTNGVFGQGEKWETPKPHNRYWLLVAITSVLAIGGLAAGCLVLFLISRRNQKPIPAVETAAIKPEDVLSPREQEIFNQLLTDIPAKVIANNFDLTYSGVNFHIKRLYKKLGVQSRIELLTKYKK